MKKRNLWICLFLLLCVCPAAAQEYTVTKSGEKKFEPLYKWGAYSGSEFSLGIGSVRSGADDRAGRDYTSPGVIGNASILVDMSHVRAHIHHTRCIPITFRRRLKYAPTRTANCVCIFRWEPEAEGCS